MSSAVIAALTALVITCTAPAFAQTDAPSPDRATAAAAASVPAYIGTWAENPGQCANAQDSGDAPKVFTKDGFDQHETHCTFTRMSNHANEWIVTSKCSVEGDIQVYEFGMSVAGTQLTLLDDVGTRLYTRCK